MVSFIREQWRIRTKGHVERTESENEGEDENAEENTREDETIPGKEKVQ